MRTRDILVFLVAFLTAPWNSNAQITITGVELKDGSDKFQTLNGRLEVSLSDGRTGTVCDADWTNNDGLAVCKYLNASYQVGYAVRDAGFGEGTGPLVVDGVNCEQSSTSLNGCTLDTTIDGGCTVAQTVGVVCSNRDLSDLPYALETNTTDNNRLLLPINDASVQICSTDMTIEHLNFVCAFLLTTLPSSVKATSFDEIDEIDVSDQSKYVLNVRMTDPSCLESASDPNTGFTTACGNKFYLLKDCPMKKVVSLTCGCVGDKFGAGCVSTCNCDDANVKDPSDECDQSGKCICNDFWEGDTCSDDIDECSLGAQNPCVSSKCTNTEGGFTCSCYVGHSKKGSSTTECQLNSGNTATEVKAVIQKPVSARPIRATYGEDDVRSALLSQCQNDVGSDCVGVEIKLMTQDANNVNVTFLLVLKKGEPGTTKATDMLIGLKSGSKNFTIAGEMVTFQSILLGSYTVKGSNDECGIFQAINGACATSTVCEVDDGKAKCVTSRAMILGDTISTSLILWITLYFFSSLLW